MQSDSIEIIEQIQNSRSQSRRATISTLNDDCLLEIFSKVPASDLSAIKKCCRRFCEVADSEAQRRYRNKPFVYCTSADHGTSHSGFVTALHNFGVFIHHIRIDMDCFCKNYDRWHYGSPGFGRFNCSVDPMLAALKHCPNLNSLTLERMQLHNVSTRKLNKLFQRLHLDTLQLIECAGIESNIARLVKSFKSLKTLTVHTEHVFSWAVEISGSILKSISEIKSIERMTFVMNELHPAFIKNVEELRHLIKLKRLELDFGECCHLDLSPAIHVLATCDSLEELILKNTTPNDAIGRALDRFTRLKLCVIETDADIADDVMKSIKNFERSLLRAYGSLDQPVYRYTMTLLRKE